jgi:hypothetical protein
MFMIYLRVSHSSEFQRLFSVLKRSTNLPLFYTFSLQSEYLPSNACPLSARIFMFARNALPSKAKKQERPFNPALNFP